MCTAEDLESLVKQKGLYNYIQKPFRIETIMDVVKDLIKTPGCSKEKDCFSQKCVRTM